MFIYIYAGMCAIYVYMLVCMYAGMYARVFACIQCDDVVWLPT